MRSASDRIWSTTIKIHQTNHPNHLLKDQPVHQEDQPTGRSSDEIDHTFQSLSLNPRGIDDRREVKSDWRVDGYSELVTDRVRAGWTCHLVTILFSQLPGPQRAIIHRMADQVLRIYNTLLTWVHRKPKSMATEDLALLVGAFDLPVHKRDRSSAPNVLCNGGLHFHALVLLPPWSRLKGSLVDHFEEKCNLYAGPSGSVRIHVRSVTGDHDRVVDYVFKTVRKGRLAYDDAVLVLPRARSELDLSISTGSFLDEQGRVRL